MNSFCILLKEVIYMEKREQELLVKKQTLMAWTEILLSKGMIDLAKCNRMKTLIQRMTS